MQEEGEKKANSKQQLTNIAVASRSKSTKNQKKEKIKQKNIIASNDSKVTATKASSK